MHRRTVLPTLAACAIAVLASQDVALASDYREQCIDYVKVLLKDPVPEGNDKLSDCVRSDITTGQIDPQSMGFAAYSDAPGRNVQKLIDAGYPVETGQGAVVIGTLNRLFLDGKLSGEAYLAAIEPLIRAGALIMFGNGELDILSELLRSSPEPETVCGFAAIAGGFDVFDDLELPRSFAAQNPSFDESDLERLRSCGL
ncbi:hypothetical protein R3X27_00230 [Tropicimonas sp. TH_r6]|uniref:hypothetical protein n=1 Tax=Tropicimonas sp. TH_r6 TaxID=3082085 RepID=UPI0029549558|nr:hypothetical protein [Tropicimonas sp. TH_r6]MDV7141096.1 hypothetical protein [Tropicimonas sp. TH_r6]